jgi:hypothetical protein
MNIDVAAVHDRRIFLNNLNKASLLERRCKMSFRDFQL